MGSEMCIRDSVTSKKMAMERLKLLYALFDSEWDAPKMEIPNNAYNNFNLSIAIFLLVTLLLAYVVDVSNILLDGMD